MSYTIVKCCVNCGSDCSDGESFCEVCKKRSSKSKTLKKSEEKFPFESFIAMKLETTGLPDMGDAQILEIAAVYGDYGQTPDSNRPKIHFYIKNEKLTWQKEAKKKVGFIEAKIGKDGIPVLTLAEAQKEFEEFLKKCLKLSGSWKNLLIARNINSLVIPMLKMHGLYFSELIDHNAMDLTSLFYFRMGERSTTKQILHRHGIVPPTDRAMDEALCVLSVMYEEVGGILKKPTLDWY